MPAKNSPQIQGFTLVEVLIALAITAVIALFAHQTFVAAADSNEQSEAILAELDALDRTWQRLGLDLRNIVLVENAVNADGEAIVSLTSEPDEDYVLRLLRGGRANLQLFERSNLQGVGYRLVDGVLWRDVWEHGLSEEEVTPVRVDLLHGIDRLQWRFLPAGVATVEDGAWVNNWPLSDSADATLPLGVEVIIESASFGEVRRIFSLLPGRNG